MLRITLHLASKNVNDADKAKVLYNKYVLKELNCLKTVQEGGIEKVHIQYQNKD